MKQLFYLQHKAAKDLKSNGGKWQLPLLILLLLILPVMAGIQHHYLGELSEAQKERLKTNLNLMAKNFSKDFDNEWMKLRQSFSFHEDSSTGFESRFNQTYLTWKQTASFPDLIKDIYFFELQNGKPILSIFDIQKGIFSPIDWPAELGEKKYFSAPSESPSNTIFFLPEFPASNKYPIIFSPCNNCQISENRKDLLSINSIIIVPDPDAVPDMLSALMRKHFPVQNDFQLDIAFVKGNRPDDVLFISDPDLDITDFHNAEIRTEIRRWGNNSGLFIALEPAGKDNSFNPKESAGKELRQPTMINIQVVKKILPDKIYNILSLDDLSPENPVVQSVTWKLMVKIRNDTLEGIVDKTRQRNLLTSYCMLAILGVSMVMVYVSARRAGSLARRQLRFVSGVSHELRTPISVIHSAGENLADGFITDLDQQKKYGRLIRDEGRRLSSMVENILSFSALQNDKTTLSLKAARIVDILEDCINSTPASGDIQEQNIKIESESKVPLVEVDYSSIKIAFNNIIENSIKYSPDDSSILIRIRYASPETLLEISFEDHGRGIDPEDLPFIFAPFFRGKNTEDQRTPGSGIGLSLVNDIIKKHGGRVEVKSKRHKGTTVSIFLPVIPETIEA